MQVLRTRSIFAAQLLATVESCGVHSEVSMSSKINTGCLLHTHTQRPHHMHVHVQFQCTFMYFQRHVLCSTQNCYCCLPQVQRIIHCMYIGTSGTACCAPCAQRHSCLKASAQRDPTDLPANPAKIAKTQTNTHTAARPSRSTREPSRD